MIPCSFQSKEHEYMTRGIWYKKTGGDIVFHNGQSYIMDHFKDRTRLLGDMHEEECSLEIDDIKPFDNGPFCFHAQRGAVKYRFTNNCAFIIMKGSESILIIDMVQFFLAFSFYTSKYNTTLFFPPSASPDKPVMSTVPAEVNAGLTVSVSCSVSHTCPSHPPEFSWSVPNITSEVSDTLISRGTWQRTSTISFIVPEGDGVQSLTCTAIFWREIQQGSTVTLMVKGEHIYLLCVCFGNSSYSELRACS